jgi:hypothetical protein
MGNPCLARLLPDFANELAPKSNKTAREMEEILRRAIYHYLANELRNGRRLAVQILNAIGQAKLVEGQSWMLFQIFRQIEHAIFLTEEEGRDFAHQEKLPPYSGWSDTTKTASQPSQSPAELKPAPMALGTSSSDQPRGETQTSRSRQLKKASEAMVRDGIRAVNEACKAAGLDGPNINKLPVFVQLGLANNMNSCRSGADRGAARQSR